jgi:hypothetical protein
VDDRAGPIDLPIDSPALGVVSAGSEWRTIPYHYYATALQKHERTDREVERFLTQSAYHERR